MTYFAYDREGNPLQWPGDFEMKQLLDSLSPRDPEHRDVSLNHQTGWSITVLNGGRVIFENVKTGEGPWHMNGKPRDEILRLWKMLSEGEIESLQEQPWLDGYGNPE
jgi:hypothetical protein